MSKQRQPSGKASASGPRPGAALALALALALLATWLFCLTPSPAEAHSVVMRQTQSQATLATTEYAGGEPMAFAKVRVIDPQGNTYQVGNADALGRFAWLPDHPGPWQVVMEDGMGHRGELTINTDQTDALQHAPPTGTLHDVPLLYRVMWGLSIIFCISGLTFWWSGRRRQIHLGSRR